MVLKMTTENSIGKTSGNTISTGKAHPVSTTEAEGGTKFSTGTTNDKQNNTSSFDSADKANGMTAVFVSVPIVAVLIIGTTLAALLVLKRKRVKKGQGFAAGKSIHKSTKNKQQTSGVANKAFVSHSKNEESGIQVSDTVGVNDQYAEITEDYRTSVMYENSNVESKLNNVPDVGYGECMAQKSNTVEEETIYQNTLDESMVPVSNLYSNLDNDNSLLYLNVQTLSTGSNCTYKTSGAKNSYYEHARAGGRDWEVKNKVWNSDDKGCRKAIPNNEKIYENTVSEKQDHPKCRSTTIKHNEEDYGEGCSNIPFYLELEEDHLYINQDSELTEAECGKQPEIKYESGNHSHHSKVNYNADQQENENYIKANIYDRHYFILEKENAMQEENTVYDGNLSHEYFILEKVEK